MFPWSPGPARAAARTTLTACAALVVAFAYGVARAAEDGDLAVATVETAHGTVARNGNARELTPSGVSGHTRLLQYSAKSFGALQS